MKAKQYSITIGFTFNLRAPNEELASERADEIIEALLEGKLGAFAKKSWYDDNLEQEETQIEEDE